MTAPDSSFTTPPTPAGPLWAAAITGSSSARVTTIEYLRNICVSPNPYRGITEYKPLVPETRPTTGGERRYLWGDWYYEEALTWLSSA